MRSIPTLLGIMLLMMSSQVFAHHQFGHYGTGGTITPTPQANPYQSTYQSPAYPEVNPKDYAPKQNYQNQISPDQAYRIQQGNACAQIWANATAQRQCYSRIK